MDDKHAAGYCSSSGAIQWLKSKIKGGRTVHLGFASCQLGGMRFPIFVTMVQKRFEP